MKRLVDIDSKLLERARAAAGTKTIKATVDYALRELAARASFEQHLRMLKKHAPEMRKHLEEARRPRFG